MFYHDNMNGPMYENGQLSHNWDPSYGELAWAVDNITDAEVFESYVDVDFVEDDFFL